mmetsp:Transcript_1896/g.3656  ORF Transcript_1896/g.3656 Transcript_1896/m.3656 type:complete len:329 (-) Transcript_1896:757-1743(-)
MIEVKVGRHQFNVGHENPSLLDCPKDQIGKLPEVPLDGIQIITVSKGADAARAIKSIWEDVENGLCDFVDFAGRKVQGIGFDTETRPTFRAGAPTNRVGLIQLATTERIVLFQLSQMGLTPELVDILCNPGLLKLGVGSTKDDIRALRSRAPKFEDNGSFIPLDVLVKAKYPSITRPGLRGITATLLGRSLSKRAQLSNWDRKNYDRRMINYAARDALVSILVLKHVFGASSLSDKDQAQRQPQPVAPLNPPPKHAPATPSAKPTVIDLAEAPSQNRPRNRRRNRKNSDNSSTKSTSSQAKRPNRKRPRNNRSQYKASAPRAKGKEQE